MVNLAADLVSFGVPQTSRNPKNIFWNVFYFVGWTAEAPKHLILRFRSSKYSKSTDMVNLAADLVSFEVPQTLSNPKNIFWNVFYFVGWTAEASKHSILRFRSSECSKSMNLVNLAADLASFEVSQTSTNPKNIFWNVFYFLGWTAEASKQSILRSWSFRNPKSMNVANLGADLVSIEVSPIARKSKHIFWNVFYFGG